MGADRAGYVQGLRALADLLEQHDEIPLPSDGRLLPVSIGFHVSSLDDDERAAAMAAAARVLMPGKRDKEVDGSYYRVTGQLHDLKVEVWAMRDQVCERVVTGTREVTREVPDPDALAAVPTTTVTETVEDVRWDCVPLLASTPEAVPA